MTKIETFISGGAMGSDPWDARSWSGSSRALLQALDRRGALGETFGLDMSKARFASLALPRFSPDREVWRRRVYRSTAYRDALTKQLSRRVESPPPHAYFN